MYKYLHIQEAPITDNITADGHVGSKLPWPVTADENGVVTVPCSIQMKRVVGFQRDLAVMQVDLWWSAAFADPQQTVGMYLVTENLEGNYQVSLTAVDAVQVLETTEPIPVER